MLADHGDAIEDDGSSAEIKSLKHQLKAERAAHFLIKKKHYHLDIKVRFIRHYLNNDSGHCSVEDVRVESKNKK
jgi:hypothetical protein